MQTNQPSTKMGEAQGGQLEPVKTGYRPDGRQKEQGRGLTRETNIEDEEDFAEFVPGRGLN